MLNYLTICIAFQICLLFIFSKIFKKFNLIKNQNNVPEIGGISIFLTIIFSMLFIDYNDFYIILIYSSFFIFIIGLLDDLFNLNPFFRIICHISASLLLISYNYKINNLGIINLNDYPSYFSTMFTIFCVLISINAYNFLDGEDGLASSNILLSILIMISFSYYFNGIPDYNLILLIFLLLLIFLIFNLNFLNIPKVYLGDSGSNLCGYLIAWYLIYLTLPKNSFFPPELCIWIIAYPVFDMLSIIIVRLLKNDSPFKGDMNHNHHKLKKRGLSVMNINLIINSLSIFFALLGLTSYLILGSTFSILIFIISFIIYHYFFYLRVNK